MLPRFMARIPCTVPLADPDREFTAPLLTLNVPPSASRFPKIMVVIPDIFKVPLLLTTLPVTMAALFRVNVP